MIFDTCKLHTTRSGVMQILSKFCHNKHLTRLYDNSVLSRYFTVTMHINALLFNSATFIKKTGSYSQKYYYKLKG